jgi:hypothetical protein
MHTKNHASSNSNSGNTQQSGALLVRLQQAFLALSILSGSAHAEWPKPPRVISDGQSHTQILGSNESPKRVIVLPGGSNTDVKNWLVVTSSVSKTPSPSATLQATKGYWQIVQLKDGTIYTYSQLLEIWKKDPNKEDAILAELPEETRRTQKREYNKWKLAWLDQEVNQLDTWIALKKQEVNQKWLVSAWLDKEVNQLDTWIALKKQEVNQKWLVSAWLDQEVNQLDTWIALKKQEVNQLDTWIALKKQEVNQLDTWIALKKQEVNQLDVQLIKKTEEYIALAEQWKLVPDRTYIKENIINNPLFDKNLRERAKKFI